MTPGELDLAADKAWPANEQVMLGPWKLRATRAVTRRANSVLTSARPELIAGQDVVQLIERVEGFYKARNIPATFYISEVAWPGDIDERLAARGYEVNGQSQVWSRKMGAGIAGEQDRDMVMASEPWPDWFACAFDEPIARRVVHEMIVRQSPMPRCLAGITDGQGRVLCCGMIVQTGSLAGIFCMNTRREYQRRGFGRRLLNQLLGWAESRGVAGCYLQVMHENKAAHGLYASAGFGAAYGYHYRTATAG